MNNNIKSYKNKHLNIGQSIDEKTIEINNCEEFGHWGLILWLVKKTKLNGLLRCFIPKGERISDYSIDDIAFIEDWMNTLPRKILNYKTTEELFNSYLD